VQPEPEPETPPASASNVIRPGERNNSLFRSCLRHASHIQAQDVEQLVRHAMEMNAQFDPPLSKAEAMGCALNAWNYHYHKRNFFTSRSLVLRLDAFDKLDDSDGGDALRLLFHLQRAHWDRDQFVLSQAFAKTLGWTVPRFLKARDRLIRADQIIRLTSGGRGIGDAPLFAWPNIANSKAAL